MKILKFRTNIESEQNVKAIGAKLDQEQSVSRWNIDIGSPGNILSVSGDHLEPDAVKKILKNAGFDAEMVQIMAVGGGDV